MRPPTALLLIGVLGWIFQFGIAQDASAVSQDDDPTRPDKLGL